MNKNILSIVLVVFLVGAGVWFLMSDQRNNDEILPTLTATPTATATPSASPTASAKPQGKVIKMDNGLQIQDIVVGTGTEAKKGDLVTVHYVGTFTNGTKFDSSVDRGQPFQFVPGVSSVIQGWHLGVPGMKVGGKRKLTIPYQLAYGENDYSSIPGKSTLLFEIELLEVKSQ